MKKRRKAPPKRDVSKVKTVVEDGAPVTVGESAGAIVRDAARRTGRPSKLTPQLIETITSALLCGMPYEHAAALAGVRKQTVGNWLARGARAHDRVEAASAQGQVLELNDEDRLYATFTTAVRKAIAECVLANLMVVKEASTKSWQAAAWTLERRWPESFAVRHELTANVGDGPRPHREVGLSDELAQQLREKFFGVNEAPTLAPPVVEAVIEPATPLAENTDVEPAAPEVPAPAKSTPQSEDGHELAPLVIRSNRFRL